MFEQYREWAKTYGKTYGYFEGPSPVIVTSDKNVLSEVFVKQFKSFHARKVRLTFSFESQLFFIQFYPFIQQSSKYLINAICKAH